MIWSFTFGAVECKCRKNTVQPPFTVPLGDGKIVQYLRKSTQSETVPQFVEQRLKNV